MEIIQGASMFTDGRHRIQLCTNTLKKFLYKYLCMFNFVNTYFLIVYFM